MRTFEERLEQYFREKDITDESLKTSIKNCLGKPSGNAEEIINEVDSDCQTYYYDASFESVLDLYSNLFSEETPAGIFESVCGYYGCDTLFVTSDLHGISVTTH